MKGACHRVRGASFTHRHRGGARCWTGPPPMPGCAVDRARRTDLRVRWSGWPRPSGAPTRRAAARGPLRQPLARTGRHDFGRRGHGGRGRILGSRRLRAALGRQRARTRGAGGRVVGLRGRAGDRSTTAGSIRGSGRAGGTVRSAGRDGSPGLWCGSTADWSRRPGTSPWPASSTARANCWRCRAGGAASLSTRADGCFWRSCTRWP